MYAYIETLCILTYTHNIHTSQYLIAPHPAQNVMLFIKATSGTSEAHKLEIIEVKLYR